MWNGSHLKRDLFLIDPHSPIFIHFFLLSSSFFFCPYSLVVLTFFFQFSSLPKSPSFLWKSSFRKKKMERIKEIKIELKRRTNSALVSFLIIIPPISSSFFLTSWMDVFLFPLWYSYYCCTINVYFYFCSALSLPCWAMLSISITLEITSLL